MTPTIPLSQESARRAMPVIDHMCAHEQRFAGSPYRPETHPDVMEPVLVKDVFDPADFSDRLFLDLFAGMSAEAERAISGLFRVYVDGMLSPKYENEVLYTAPLPGEGFQDYVTRAVGGRRFGIIVNGAEQWSDPLARMAARLFEPVVRAQGARTSTIEVTLFIGNYGYTPFGIHIDDPYTSVVHFHLGPTPKAMTLFDRAQFHALNGPRKNCFEPDRLTSAGKTFLIQPGDVFLLPPHWYHIGNTDGFSIGIAFAVSRYSEQKHSEQLLQFATSAKRIKQLFDPFVASTRETGQPLADFLESAQQENQAQSRSRSALRYSAPRRPLAAPADDDTLWIRDPDFPMQVVASPRSLQVYARGNHLRLAASDTTRALVDAIPEGPFSCAQLHRRSEGRGSPAAVRQLVSALAELGGLIRHPGQEARR